MEIIIKNILLQNEIELIRALEKECIKEEKLQNQLFLSNEINFNREFPCFYLGYENDNLIAFLTTFIPTFSEAEILAVTHPNYRRKGCFKMLLNKAKAELQKAGINKILFAVESNSKSGIAVLNSFKNITFEHSEYRMIYENVHNSIEPFDLDIKEVNHDNLLIFNEITKEAFSDVEDSNNYMDTIIASKNRKGYLLYKKEIPIGVFCLNIENEQVFLYGVVISLKYRGKGYGKQLLKHVIEQSLKFGNTIILDVDSNNPIAFHIYQKCGFHIKFQVDYFKMIIIS